MDIRSGVGASKDKSYFPFITGRWHASSFCRLTQGHKLRLDAAAVEEAS
jgi:hypothetical protein